MPNGQCASSGKLMTAPNAMYSRRRARTTLALSSTDSVLSCTAGWGMEGEIECNASCHPLRNLL